MRRFFVGVALFTLAAVTPLAAWGGDREIAEQIYSKLKGQQAAGVLQGFTLDMDVSGGRVLLKGHVSSEEQRTAVLAAAKGISGVTDVVDQISVGKGAEAVSPSKPTPVTLDAIARPDRPAMPSFSLSKALAEQKPASREAFVTPVAATRESPETNDQELKSAVIRTLGDAQRAGVLRGFGLEVSSVDGDVLLRGRSRDDAQKQMIMEMVRRVPGVRNVIDDITVTAAPAVAPAAALESAPEVRHLQPVDVQTVSGRLPNANGPVAPAAPMQVQGPTAGHPVAYMANAAQDPATAGNAGVPYDPNCVGGAYAGGAYAGGGYAGMPVPAGPVPMGYAAPRYDSPNLPNYAWPGYAAYPNYAALTYPQQYSPTAWPYIGPFYPYPQVPLGWRKVSLEWDDGWWFLDFTDK